MPFITVRELTWRVKELLESDSLLGNLWVKGEISNYKKAASGHIYFTLKDSYSCVRVVMFRSRARNLQFGMENGLAVRVNGYVTVFERDGQYQLYAERVEPDGEGALYAALEKLKQKLAAEGLFDPARKKKLPSFPGCIGLVTSPTGAAVRDMINILRRRWPAVRIILAPVAVQGETAPEEVAGGIRLLNKLPGVDLVIAGRGGGSLEELWAFNTEIVVRSIAASNLPVISAVGHETDFTLSDLAADLRAPTPSAAAEIAVPERVEIKRMIDMHRVRITRCMQQKTSAYLQRLEQCARNRVLARPVETICDQRRMVLDQLERQLGKVVQGSVKESAGKIALLAGRLDALSPLATLARGYSLSFGPDGQVLREARQVKTGDFVTVRLHHGVLECEVREINKTKDS
ncbi:Exodeoxyribonuclease VII large subunit [Desulfotomaculum arcticum]|uniref:Exodeoxyribonuclease 7 large subunit n=1 Tax=Desulfotruncus arcticus DSM 17038 TaxID=1121424 RepID=A0A1I2MQ98_9FIRM|nr:exodeoxyribonuclease VII large subunit [Desulfotruncus arcticus]SFF93623.1 Exodeoxyribonuclease VII large subunit [Desulfotomaculum arcticum] [Desulfotruncus arcticus DSM 17038]